MTSSDSYFVRTGEHSFEPTSHTSGAWNTAEQHISPLTGLVAHAIERAAGTDDGKTIARLSFDILWVVGLEPFSINVRTIRPGRTIELVEAVVQCADRDVLICRAWRLADHDTAAIAGGQGAGLPSPDGLADWDLSTVWPGGYIASVTGRPVTEPAAGHTTTWLRSPVTLLDNEPVSDFARFIGLVDTANGLAVRESIALWLFPTVDLSIHLFRQPRGLSLGLHTRVTFGPHGPGLTTSRLYDESGPVGAAEQALTIRPQSGHD